MVIYWCVWCGERTERSTSREAPQCTRCITEFQLGFGFPLRTLMIPLERANAPGAPGAGLKRFTFADPEGVREAWSTSCCRVDDEEATAYDEVFSADDQVFTVYDVGA